MGDLLDDLRIFILHLFTGAKLFQRRRVNLVAGSATFFAVLSSLPLLMLFMTAAGIFLDDYAQAQGHILSTIKQNFPNLSPWVYKNIEKVLSGQLTSHKKVDYFSIGFLVFFSIAFFNAVLNGIDIITRNFEEKNWFNRISSILGIALSVLFFNMLVVISPLARSLQNLSSIPEVQLFFNEQAPSLNFLAGSLNNFGGLVAIIITSPLFAIVICLLYFTFLYRWIFRFKETWSDCLYGAITFAGAFILGRWLFGYYLLYASDNIKQNFGDFYAMIVALMWIYFVMCAFFYGACVVHGDPEGELIANN